MKTRNRIATAVAVALASVFVATPAFAHGGDHSDSIFSSAGQPVEIVPILIVVGILLVVVLALAAWVTSLTSSKN